MLYSAILRWCLVTREEVVLFEGMTWQWQQQRDLFFVATGSCIYQRMDPTTLQIRFMCLVDGTQSIRCMTLSRVHMFSLEKFNLQARERHICLDRKLRGSRKNALMKSNPLPRLNKVISHGNDSFSSKVLTPAPVKVQEVSLERDDLESLPVCV